MRNELTRNEFGYYSVRESFIAILDVVAHLINNEPVEGT